MRISDWSSDVCSSDLISDLAISPIEPTAERSTSVRLSAYRLQSTLSPQVTTETSRLFFVVSGTPAYAATAAAEETPGTIPKPPPAFVKACASTGPEAQTTGSPFNRLTTRPHRLNIFNKPFERVRCVQDSHFLQHTPPTNPGPP